MRAPTRLVNQNPGIRVRRYREPVGRMSYHISCDRVEPTDGARSSAVCQAHRVAAQARQTGLKLLNSGIYHEAREGPVTTWSDLGLSVLGFRPIDTQAAKEALMRGD